MFLRIHLRFFYKFHKVFSCQPPKNKKKIDK